MPFQPFTHPVCPAELFNTAQDVKIGRCTGVSTFRPTEISPHGLFAPWKDISPHRRFAPWTSRPTDDVNINKL